MQSRQSPRIEPRAHWLELPVLGPLSSHQPLQSCTRGIECSSLSEHTVRTNSIGIDQKILRKQTMLSVSLISLSLHVVEHLASAGK